MNHLLRGHHSTNKKWLSRTWWNHKASLKASFSAFNDYAVHSFVHQTTKLRHHRRTMSPKRLSKLVLINLSFFLWFCCTSHPPSPLPWPLPLPMIASSDLISSDLTVCVYWSALAEKRTASNLSHPLVYLSSLFSHRWWFIRLPDHKSNRFLSTEF